ncbi:MAG: GNAT family N-acetyltransferase [Alphaproteobacteria bacterium]|nr:GNAT family N-acetyltransferase [Alphaproteobacteria bacterium]MDE2493678.1 GNAT family N-acetyltransferase [Alphaproteobacteria bacterium]
MSEQFTIEPLSDKHDRQAFSCGSPKLDRYLQTQAGQDARRRIASCFVAVGDAGIAGYYTLCASSIPISDLPQSLVKKLPRYPVLPAALVGRLTVDRRYAGRGLGSALLYDAIARSLRADPMVYALIAEAKDDAAAGFYTHFGFQAFESRPMSFFLPMATAAKLT